MLKRTITFLIVVLALGLVPFAALAQDELPSPIPGVECNPDAEVDMDNPIVVGGSLSLTGPLAPTANIHRVVGNLFVDWANECGGVLGRAVAWTLLDDQTSAEQVTANYERLITVDNVDLLMGPYGGGNILAGAGPAQQNNMVYVTHTNGVPQVDLGEYHFPSWQIGNGENPEDVPPWELHAKVMWDAVLSVENPPQTAFYLTNQFPTTLEMTAGVVAEGEARGIEQLGETVEYAFGTADFSAVAQRIALEDPDFIYMGAIGLDGVNLFDAFESIAYVPRGIYVALPAPGPMMALGDVANGTMSLSIFEVNSALGTDPVTQEFIARFQAAADEEGLLNIVETQAAASMSAWQLLFAAVVATEGTEQDAIKDWLHANEFNVVAGAISFDGFNGYGTDYSRIVQIQDGERFLVWPPELRLEGVEVQYPN
jgi:branched-chain amino acid transport system substrate-binding protein